MSAPDVVPVLLPGNSLETVVVSEVSPEDSSAFSVGPMDDSGMFLCEFSFATFSSIL